MKFKFFFAGTGMADSGGAATLGIEWLAGRVRVKVDATQAPITVGDLLVTSDTEGVAMKSEPVTVGGRKLHAPGTIIGKALEPLASQRQPSRIREPLCG